MLEKGKGFKWKISLELGYTIWTLSGCQTKGKRVQKLLLISWFDIVLVDWVSKCFGATVFLNAKTQYKTYWHLFERKIAGEEFSSKTFKKNHLIYSLNYDTVFGHFLVTKQKTNRYRNRFLDLDLTFCFKCNANYFVMWPKCPNTLGLFLKDHLSGCYCLHWLSVRAFFSIVYILTNRWARCLMKSFSFLCHCAAMCESCDPWPDGLVSMGAAEGEMSVFVTQSQCAPRVWWPETKVFACVFACVRKEITP